MLEKTSWNLKKSRASRGILGSFISKSDLVNRMLYYCCYCWEKKREERKNEEKWFGFSSPESESNWMENLNVEKNDVVQWPKPTSNWILYLMLCIADCRLSHEYFPLFLCWAFPAVSFRIFHKLTFMTIIGGSADNVTRVDPESD